MIESRVKVRRIIHTIHAVADIAACRPGFHSFEIKVDDGPGVATFLKESGCKLSAEYGSFFYVRQESTGGVASLSVNGVVH